MICPTNIVCLRTRKLIAAAFLVSIFFSDLTTADEQRLTSRQLAEACGVQRQDLIERAHCVAYIAGVLDAYQSVSQIGSIDGSLCFPAEGISPAAAIGIFNSWYKANSVRAYLSAATAVLLAMRERFPCS